MVQILVTFLELFQQVQYHAHSYGGKTKTVKNILVEKKRGKIKGGGTDVRRDEKMPIPPVPPSYLLGCKIIDIRYLLMVSKAVFMCTICTQVQICSREQIYTRVQICTPLCRVHMPMNCVHTHIDLIRNLTQGTHFYEKFAVFGCSK